MTIGPVSQEAAQHWVDSGTGMVSRSIFVDEEIYEREIEQVFARAWLFLGHESQIAKPGDYFVSRMGEESVILTRDRQGEIHAFLNSCMHRGMKVCRYDEGNTPVFTCPYHGWSYGLDGSLVGVPYFKEAYHSELKKNEWGLVEVAQLANYKGWIWATWDKEAPSLEDYLGDMRIYFDLMTDHPDGSPGGQRTWVGVQKWIMPANWKFAAENFIGDFYHNVSHRSVDLVGISPSGRKGRHLDDTSQIRRVLVNYANPEQGHGAGFFHASGDLPYNPSYGLAPSAVEAYFEKAHYARQARLGERARAQGAVGTVFPNASISAGRSIAVWHPNGPHSTEAWRFYFAPADAPQEVVDTLRHYAMRYAGAGGMTEQDDMENWNYATSASAGAMARRNDYHYAMGLGHESTDPPAAWMGQGLFSTGTSEQNQRTMYKRWAEYMAASSWAQL